MFLQKSLGAVPGPFDSWLVLRGLKTLAVRMREHCRNAHSVAAFLERHPRVEQVLYPGLPGHRGHTIAAHQMRDFGGMVSFLAESEEEAVAICASHEDLPAGREPRRRREPDRAPGPDDPRLDGRRAVRGAAQPRAALGRARVGGRPGRRPRGRARSLDGDCRRLTRAARPGAAGARRVPPASEPRGRGHAAARRLATHRPDVVRLAGRPRATEHGRHPAAAQLPATRPAGGVDGARRRRGRLVQPRQPPRPGGLDRRRRVARGHRPARGALHGKPFRKRDKPRVSAWLEPERWHGWS